jgi:hypothetical protein
MDDLLAPDRRENFRISRKQFPPAVNAVSIYYIARPPKIQEKK